MEENENIINEAMPEEKAVEETPVMETPKEEAPAKKAPKAPRPKPVPAEDFDWTSSHKKFDNYSADERAKLEERYAGTMRPSIGYARWNSLVRSGSLGMSFAVPPFTSAFSNRKMLSAQAIIRWISTFSMFLMFLT